MSSRRGSLNCTEPRWVEKDSLTPDCTQEQMLIWLRWEECGRGARRQADGPDDRSAAPAMWRGRLSRLKMIPGSYQAIKRSAASYTGALMALSILIFPSFSIIGVTNIPLFFVFFNECPPQVTPPQTKKQKTIVTANSDPPIPFHCTTTSNQPWRECGYSTWSRNSKTSKVLMPLWSKWSSQNKYLKTR